MYSASARMLSGSAVSMATHRLVGGEADAFSPILRVYISKCDYS